MVDGYFKGFVGFSFAAHVGITKNEFKAIESGNFKFSVEKGISQQEKDIVTWLDELSGYLNGCIEFFNDVDEIYSKDYIYVRSINDDGTATLGECWSYVGQITKFYNMESQDLNLSPPNPDACYWDHCIWKSVVLHEFRKTS